MSKIPNFGIVNKEVVTDPNLSLQAKGLYAILSSYCDKNRRCFPSLNTLSDISSKSISQISLYIKELKTTGYLTRKGKYLILR